MNLPSLKQLRFLSWKRLPGCRNGFCPGSKSWSCSEDGPCCYRSVLTFIFLPAAIITFAIIAVCVAGCSASRSNFESPCLAWEHRHIGWAGSNDSQPYAYVADEGATPLGSGDWSGSADIHNSKVRSSSYTASSNSQWSAGSLGSPSVVQETKESTMFENFGYSIAAIIIAYAFGAATGPSLWAWMKSRGK